MRRGSSEQRMTNFFFFIAPSFSFSFLCFSISSQMGGSKSKRKPAKKGGPPPLEKQFTCPFCNHEKAVTCEMQEIPLPSPLPAFFLSLSTRLTHFYCVTISTGTGRTKSERFCAPNARKPILPSFMVSQTSFCFLFPHLGHPFFFFFFFGFDRWLKDPSFSLVSCCRIERGG